MKTFIRPSRRKNDTHLNVYQPTINLDKTVGMIKVDPAKPGLLIIESNVEYYGIEFYGHSITWSFESEKERNLEWDILMEKVCVNV